METEGLDDGNNETPYEVTVELEKSEDIFHDKEVEISDSNEKCDVQQIVVILPALSDNYNDEDMDLDVSVLEEERERIIVEVVNNSSGGATIDESPQAVTVDESDVKVSNTTVKPRQETDFVSDDPKENSDNFDKKWDDLRSLSAKDDKYGFIQKRWGNSAMPDPSIDLTYRHRTTRIRGRPRKRKAPREGKKNTRSLSCVSHMEKLMNDIKANYYSELNKLCERHSLIMSDMQRHYQSRFVNLLQRSIHNVWFHPNTAQTLMMQQQQEEMHQINKYQNQVQNLVSKANLSLSRYEQYSNEILMFHQQYQIGDDTLLKSEQVMHLQDTERMYKEYERFYS